MPPELDQGLGTIVTQTTVVDELRVEPLGLAGGREVKAHRLGFVQGDPKILQKVLGEESRGVIALEDPWAIGAEAEVLCCTTLQRGDDLLQVEVGSLGVDQGLGQTGHRAGNHDLVGHLGVLATTSGTVIADRFAELVEEGRQVVKDSGVTADHHRQGAVLGANVTTGDRGVEDVNPTLGPRRVDPLGERRLAGGHVDQVLTGRGVGQDAVITKVDLLDILRKANHREDNVSLPGDRGRGVGPLSTVVKDRLGVGLGPVVDQDRVTMPQEVVDDPGPHDAGADKTNLIHICRFLFFPL